MNQRIEQLESTCWKQVPCDFDMAAGGLSTIRTVFNRKKFAELIVRECLHIADEFELEVNRSGLVDRIKEHFGVEE